jgi:ribonuclease D
MYKENITAEELSEHELSWFKGEIVIVDSLRKFNDVFPRLKNETLLGFDTETKPTFKKGRKNNVSLLQLSGNDLAVLFRLNKIGLPEKLAALLADKNIIKAGVAVHDDIKSLRGLTRFNPDGFVDLQQFVREWGIQDSGLKKLVAIVLGFRISKRQQVTDWEAEELTEAQAVYAATDAWVCYQIYKKLLKSEKPPVNQVVTGDIAK